jgi:hypothetical protein
MSIDAKDVARQYILDNVEQTNDVGDFLSEQNGADKLTADGYDALKDEIYDLIDEAMVTVILPGDDVCPHCHGCGTPEQAESEAGK